MNRAIEVVFYREGERWLAQALNVDVATFGDSPDDACASIKEALELYLEELHDGEIGRATDARVEQLLVQAVR